MKPEFAFPAGSIIKPCIGALALQLEVQGALSLEDLLQQWVPEFNSATPTLRQVLHHTAGIKCFTELLYWLPYPLQVHNAQRRWSDADAIAIANHFPPYFDPSAGFHYSNCGYALLGLALERAASVAAGRTVTMEELLRTRIWEPAGIAAPAGETRYIRYDPPLPNTQALPDSPWPELVMHGYMKPEHGGYDVTQYETYSLYGPAGAMLSSLQDLLTLSVWLFGSRGGAVLRPVGSEQGSRAENCSAPTGLLEAVPADGPGKSYGLGVQIFERDWAGGRFYGHGGNVMGWSSGMWYFPARDLHLAFVANVALVRERPIFEALLAYADSVSQK